MLHKFLKTFLCKLLQPWKSGAVLIFITGIGCSPFSETNRNYIFDFLDNIEQAKIQGQPLESADSYKITVSHNPSENVRIDGIDFFPIPLDKANKQSSHNLEGLIETSFTFDNPTKKKLEFQNHKPKIEIKSPASIFPDWLPIKGDWKIGEQTVSNSPPKKFSPNNVIFKFLNGLPIYWVPKGTDLILAETAPSHNGFISVKISFDETQGKDYWYEDAKNQRRIRGINQLAGIIYNVSSYKLRGKETIDGTAVLTNKNGDLFYGKITQSKLVTIEPLNSVLKSLTHSISNKTEQNLSIQFAENGLSIWLNKSFQKQIINLPAYLGNIGLLNSIGGGTSFNDFQYSIKPKKLDEKNLAGIYFLPKDSSLFNSIVVTNQGYLKVGQLGKKPIKIKPVSIVSSSKNDLKVIFNKDYYAVYFNRRREMEIPISLMSPEIESDAVNDSNITKEKIGYIGTFKKGKEVSLKKIIYAIDSQKNQGLTVKNWDQFEFLKSLFVKRETKLEEKSKYIISDVKYNTTTARSLITKAPSTVKFRLKIPQKAFLSFSPKLISAPAEGEASKKIKFSVQAYRQNVKSELFSKTLFEEELSDFQQEKIDLKDFAGEETEIHFISQSKDNVFALWGNPQILTERNENDLNVILISIDTLRADHLTSYGYKPNISPNLNKIAQKGTQFNQAISQAPWTLPSHMSMLTSYYPMALGYRPHHEEIMIPGKVKTLAQKLQNNGYITAGFVGGGYVSSQYGFSRGFSFYEEKYLEDVESVLDQVNRWLNRHQNDKFFLFFHTYETHQYEHSENDDETIASYDSKIKLVDQKITKLFDFLKKTKLDAKTLVIFTSNHGEGFGEHVWRGHTTSLYEEQIRVPLIFNLPGTIPENLKIDRQVSLVDILPTVLDLLDLPPEPNLEGKSLRPFFNNKPEDRIAFSSSTRGQEKASVVSLRTNTHKYIEFDFADEKAKDSILKENDAVQLKPRTTTQGYEFYNLKENPGEWGDKKLKYNSQSKESSEIIKEFRRANQKKWKLMESPDAQKVELDQSTRQHLQALGYLQ
jgi:arylsulfatase A-like enzyme